MDIKGDNKKYLVKSEEKEEEEEKWNKEKMRQIENKQQDGSYKPKHIHIHSKC